MNTARQMLVMDYQDDFDCADEEEIYFTDVFEDDVHNTAEIIDPLWDDFLSSELDWEEALSTGYMTY